MRARTNRHTRREKARHQLARDGEPQIVTDDEIWHAWLARHPYDAELWAEEGDRFRQAIEATFDYVRHRAGYTWTKIWRQLWDDFVDKHPEDRA